MVSFLFFRGILDFSLLHLYSDIDATYSKNEEDIRKYRIHQLEKRIISWKLRYSLNSVFYHMNISRLITLYLKNSKKIVNF